ncbi:RNA polymerase sigma factor SigJ [Agromyces aerolatus]|uniref:RNA polymerase sigma factor SigJ n=1 Tax=Agromyces sp. LY-1074 TaxID=3074080 RepID=UPI0028543E63|nr:MULTISPECIES: RNA polymerase sigma factor SigJ [unclassified Agromyces]MDR5699657.1 RNA polymerase sigma factor SigJ [Agromyces sp. LY-1074]MDR5705953.1 RNA polymerase sigma factor SigJ [Agromyces sp. LY-1358]
MPTDPELSELLGERRRLMNLAFRMLGSWNDAEDVVQQTFVRWYQLDPDARAAIERPAAWLTTTASRLCLNVLDSARVRTERYVGPWLPEPVPTDVAPGAAIAVDPLDRIALDDSVSMALLVVLEALTPAERVVFVLHEVFALPFPEIAEIVERSPAATRQLATSARRHLRAARTRPASAADHDRLVTAFRAACEAGDLEALIAVLDPGVVSTSDGGGKVNAARRPIDGADNVARFLLGILAKRPDVSIEERAVNGRTGFVVVNPDGGVEGVLQLGTSSADGRPGHARIDRIWIVLNPDKLRAWRAPEPG